MHPRFTLAALAVSSTFCVFAPAFAQDNDHSVIITATRIATKDTAAPFASEVHTRTQIENSGATTVFDYLAQHSSLQIMPSYGNRNTPKIDMRGYGMGDGYQNIVVTLDGARMNNIDMTSPLIGALPAADIERIEITKGSGSVLYGDGATAGTIQIITRQAANGGRVEVSAGSKGAFSATASAGLRTSNATLSASATRLNSDGFSEPDAKGHRDASNTDNWKVDARVSPLDQLTFRAGAANAKTATRYPNALTQAQFDANPAQNGGNTQYTELHLDSKTWQAGADVWFNPQLKLSLDQRHEDKTADFNGQWGPYGSEYDYTGTDLSLQFTHDKTVVTVGAQKFEGDRLSAGSNTTSKNNLGWFAQAQQGYDALTLSLGARSEEVEYVYQPMTGTSSAQKDKLTAWDIGINVGVDASLSLFANLNESFQAPDIDRFFNFGGSFNAFIKPAHSRTLTAGLNHLSASNKLKLAAFHVKLRDEIYYYDSGDYMSSFNTNIDRSRKFGLELQDIWKISPTTQLSTNYAYTRALIDREDQGNGFYNGRELPGVSRHSINLGLSHAVDAKTQVGLSQSWRSSTWSASDFDNNNAQKQRAYYSTDLTARHRVNPEMELFANISNLLDKANGTWVADDAIYANNFSRSIKLGLRAQF